MKTQKAIEWLKAWSATHQNENENVREAVWSGIQALEEVEQYRALGTVEELKEAREKQVAKKCEIYTALQIGIDKDYEVDVYECPKCGTHLGVADEINQSPYCWNCGQALKWGEEDD